MSFIQHLSPRPKRILVNHGETSRCLDLASSIHKQFRIETEAPRNLETVRIK
jgi:predicted metal-dependent RNase